MQRYRMLIGGRHVTAANGRGIRSINPATEEGFAEFPDGGPEDVDLAVQSARKAAPEWAALEHPDRAAMMRKVVAAIRNRAGEFAALETEDAGKPIHDTTNFDTPDAAHAFDSFAEAAAHVYGETIPVRRSLLDYTARTPVGVVAQIAPWNFPLVNAAWKIAPAIAMGNTVVFKPSELATCTALLLGEILAGELPEGVVNIVTGYGATAGAALVAHPGVNKVSFTGSTTTGKSVLATAAQRLSPACLELGGKSPNIVFADANPEAAVAGVLFGIFFNAGQVCTAGSRLLVAAEIYDSFLERLVAAAASIKSGPPTDLSTRLGPLISRPQQERVQGFIQRGIADGARVCFEGPHVEKKGYYVPPVIFDRVEPASAIARDEIFGPVLCVFPFRSDEEAIAMANDTPYGLAAGVWTRDLSRAHRVTSRLNCGTVWVNTYNLVTPQTPAPARKDSGIGVELGLEGLREYTMLKNVVVNFDEPQFNYFA